MHRLSHRIKKVAGSYDFKVVLSDNIGCVCSLAKQKFGEQKSVQEDCSVKHMHQFVKCVKNVVYNLPMTCGHVYVGQPGRYINTKLGEHTCSLKGHPSAHLALHCNECACTPCFSSTTIEFSHHNQTSRETVEAFCIEKQKEVF